MAFVVGKNIASQNVSFTQITYGISYLPLIPYTELSGFAPEGVQFQDVEIAELNKGSDGLIYINQKPAIYRGTINLLANSPCRNALDLVCNAITPKYGHTFNTASLSLIEKNTMTGYIYVYTEGIITTVKSGNDSNRDSGQTPKTYNFAFGNMVQLPL